MRYVVVFVLLVVLAPIAQAEVTGSQWNDSNTVQLPGGPDTYPGDTTVPDVGLGSGAAGPPSPGASAGEASQSGNNPSISSETPSDIIIFSNPSSSSGGSNPGEESDAGSLLNLLIESGALSGSPSTNSGSPHEGASILDASSGMYIDGAKVRAALQGKGILRVTLRAFGVAGGVLSNSDLGLIGASTILKNPALESVFISLTRFDITYRSQGYLLAFVPVSFPVRISVNPNAATLAERVTVKFPWYSFFLRKFVSKSALIADIDAIITKDADPAIDRSQLQAKIFTDVSIMLQSRVDTVEESVQ